MEVTNCFKCECLKCQIVSCFKCPIEKCQLLQQRQCLEGNCNKLFITLSEVYNTIEYEHVNGSYKS